MINILNADITQRMPHLIATFYQRTAFCFHSQGIPKGEAEGKARRKCEECLCVPVNMIFPPVPWDKYELIYPKNEKD